MKILLQMIFIACVLGTAGCWFIAAANMFKMVLHRKPDVPLWPSWYDGPFNIIFRPHQLTDRAHRTQTRFLRRKWFLRMLVLSDGLRIACRIEVIPAFSNQPLVFVRQRG